MDGKAFTNFIRCCNLGAESVIARQIITSSSSSRLPCSLRLLTWNIRKARTSQKGQNTNFASAMFAGAEAIVTTEPTGLTPACLGQKA